MARSRSQVLAVALIATCVWAACYQALHGEGFALGSANRGHTGAAVRGSGLGLGRTQLWARGGSATATTVEKTDAKEADDELENESIEVGGFAGFLVGLALMPYVIYCLVCLWDILVGSKSFAWGPYGLEGLACFITTCTTIWSLGSFLQRGRGLPAGPFGLLGLAEGLSYIAALGLVVATGVTYVRSPSTSPIAAITKLAPADLKAPDIKLPDFKAPDFKAPDIKAPEFKAPEFKAPAFKAPDIKVPEFKAPDIKVPEFKAPDIKVPEFKAPNLKLPSIPKSLDQKKEEGKAPEPEKKAPEPEKKAPEPDKKPAPAPAPPAAAKKDAPAKPAAEEDYDDLFN